MEYKGELYGRISARKYFPLGKSSEDWDKLEAQNKKLVDFAKKISQMSAQSLEYSDLIEEAEELINNNQQGD